ncbi:MAG: RelA/SpoT domain-containing protein [Desulfuromonadales bacterium]|nr:RelA/SpoT domain-containing protein [Desulfuromonadales bacterium]
MNDVVNFIDYIKIDLEREFSILQTTINQDISNRIVPIYTTKYRIKSIESAYLKTKRKEISDLNTITDYGGMRVLCLFQKDALKTHDYLMKLFSDRNYVLSEFNLFNWTDILEDTQTIISNHQSDVKVNPLNKTSGYKSMHYILKIPIKKAHYFIEIQLRTLLQDVWGELEHSLSYKKGAIHPHIKKSFTLLARDLETNDILMTHLKDISEKDQFLEQFSNKKYIPRNYFHYEDDIIPAILITGKLLPIYKKYDELVKSIKTMDSGTVVSGVDEARAAYSELLEIIPYKAAKEQNTGYWLDMENAYLLFCEQKHEEAFQLYTRVLEKYKINYCVFFRIGELELKKKNIEKALAAFDECENILDTIKIIDGVNFYRIKLRLALIYWMLGDEYIDIAISKISQADKIYSEEEAVRALEKYSVLINNITWYSLSKYINCKPKEKNEYFRIVKDNFKILEKYMHSDATSNMYDTAAWYCYHHYLKTKNIKHLEDAKRYCLLMKDKVNYTSTNWLSESIHENHFYEIMSVVEWRKSD